MIFGIGIDIVEIEVVKKLLSVKGDVFIKRTFTESEIKKFQKSKRLDYLAGRFAAKEAIIKSMNSAFVDGVALTDIEILSSAKGSPDIILHNGVLDLYTRLGIRNILVSISHSDHYAISNAISEK